MSDISDRRTDLPPRAIGVPDTGQGLFQKFEVRRTDGSSEPGGKHEGCEYFVLDTDHDPLSQVALRAYADACEATHPILARDLRERYHLEEGPEPDYLLVPILERFDQAKALGWIKVLRAALPPKPDFCFSIGYEVRHSAGEYVLYAASITSDSEYERVIDREKGRLLTEPIEQVVQALRERAIGIARDIADAFAKRRNDGSSTETLFVRLADELLREPELVKAIAAWHAAAVDALRDGELPKAVPGRARDLAMSLSNFSPESHVSSCSSWSMGMVVRFLHEIADNWNRRPAAGMVLSQSGKRSSILGPVVIDATARWAGAIQDAEGGWDFSSENWQKFVDALSAEPPLDLMTSPGVSAPESMLHERCVEHGCQRGRQCPIGKCAKGAQR